MPYDSIKAQLSLCHLLQLNLQSDFPNCMMIPFGAAVSGHGTLTSDCDICLMTNPSEQMRKTFSPSNYYAPHVLAMWQEIVGKHRSGEVLSPSLLNMTAPPPSVTMETNDEDDDSSNTSLTSTSSCSSPPPEQYTLKKPPEFEKVLSVVNKMPEATKILPLAHARCPIIRFQLKTSKLHCDLSINNRLVLIHLPRSM